MIHWFLRFTTAKINYVHITISDLYAKSIKSCLLAYIEMLAEKKHKKNVDNINIIFSNNYNGQQKNLLTE